MKSSVPTTLKSTSSTVRFHVILPRDLLATLDKVVSKGKRSEFVADALREKLTHEVQGEALRATAGILDHSRYPEWETPETTAAWVRELRAVDTEATDRKLDRR